MKISWLCVDREHVLCMHALLHTGGLGPAVAPACGCAGLVPPSSAHLHSNKPSLVVVKRAVVIPRCGTGADVGRTAHALGVRRGWTDPEGDVFGLGGAQRHAARVRAVCAALKMDAMHREVGSQVPLAEGDEGKVLIVRHWRNRQRCLFTRRLSLRSSPPLALVTWIQGWVPSAPPAPVCAKLEVRVVSATSSTACKDAQA